MNKPVAFVIMPIENPDTEFLWEEVYKPVLDELGYHPCRSKEDDNGQEMTGRIRWRINTSDLLIADLTLARPNCYYEIGLAMGNNRENNLVLCCRDGEPVHFDISTYYVVRWTRDRMDNFKNELKQKIQQRTNFIKQTPPNRDFKYQEGRPDFYQNSLSELRKWKKTK